MTTRELQQAAAALAAARDALVQAAIAWREAWRHRNREIVDRMDDLAAAVDNYYAAVERLAAAVEHGDRPCAQAQADAAGGSEFGEWSG